MQDMHCLECGVKIVGSARYCANCGASIDQKTATVRGEAVLQRGEVKCKNCEIIFIPQAIDSKKQTTIKAIAKSAVFLPAGIHEVFRGKNPECPNCGHKNWKL